MFWNRKLKIKTEMIQAIRPTSKATLKMQCLMVCNGDVEKAKQLYDFYIEDMKDLPMFDIPVPTTLQQVKETAAQTFTWLNENQEQLMNWAGLFRQMFSKSGQAVAQSAAQAAATPVPPIN